MKKKSIKYIGSSKACSKYLPFAIQKCKLADKKRKNKRAERRLYSFSNSVYVLVTATKYLYSIIIKAGSVVKFSLVFSPVFNKATFGWGAPFTDSNGSINPPFGSDLLGTDDFNTRHKIAELDTTTITQQFGIQHKEAGIPEHMGNNYWSSKVSTDADYVNTDIVSWWGIPGVGTSGGIYPVIRIRYCEPMAIGDIVNVEENGTLDTKYLLITGYKNIPCTNPPTLRIFLTDFGLSFYYEHLVDLCDWIFVNDTKIMLQGVTKGSYGAFIVGACLYKGWLIYNTVAVNNDGSSKPDEVHAINITTLEYKALGSYPIEDNSGWYAGNGWHGLKPVIYSQDGTSSVVPRHNEQWNQFEYERVRGSLSLGGDSKPVLSVVVDWRPEGSEYSPYSYGYKDNTEWWRITTLSSDYVITHMNEQYKFLLGFRTYTKTCHDTSGILTFSLFVQFEDNIWFYPVDQSTGLPDFSTVASSGASIEDYDTPQISGTNHSALAWEGGVLLSIGNMFMYGVYFDIDNDPNPGDCEIKLNTSHHNINVWIKPDGTVVDLGETLLDNTVNGSQLSVRPMTLQITK